MRRKMGPRRSPEMSGGLAGCALRGFRSVADFDFDAAPKPPQAVLIPVKSKFGVEFRRTSILLEPLEQTFDNFLALICDLHNVKPDEEGNLEELVLSYTSSNGDTLPISNDDNLRFCLHSRLPLLRLSLQRKSESYEEQQGYGKVGRGRSVTKKNRVTISNPQDFRRVSSILDANVLPRQLRRVELCKYYTNKPLGFYIKEGYSERATPYGIMATTGIFISRLLENGLAASTNLLSKGDEILEVNGIDVTGRAIDQVTDMMHANAKNLILTVKPVTETHPALPIPATYLMPPPPMYTHVPMPFFGFPAPPPASEIACPNRIRTYDQSLKEIHRKMAKSVLIEVDPVYRPPGYRFHDENKRNSTSYSSGDQSTSSRSTSGRFTPKLAVPDLNHNRRSMFCASNNQTLNPPQTGQKTSFETFSRNSTLRVEDKANPASIRSPRSLLRSQNHEKRPFSVHFDPRVVRGAQSPSHLTVF